MVDKNNNKDTIVSTTDQHNATIELSDDEKIMLVAKKILEKYKEAFIELAK